MEWAFSTIRSRGTTKHILGRKLHSGTFKAIAAQGGLVRVAFFLEVPLLNLRTRMCYIVPCDRILKRAYCIIL